MADKKTYDLTSGRILDKLIVISLPIVATQVVQMLYNLSDMFWLGRIGSGPVAASGIVGMYMWLSVSFFMPGRMGGEIGVSQNLGRGDRQTAGRFGQSAVQIALTLGISYCLVMLLFTKQLIGFFGVKEALVFEDARRYLRIVACGVPFTFFSAAATGIYNGSGNSRIPFIINAAGLVLNMIFDPILIITLKLGIVGGGYSTIGGQILVAISLGLFLRFHKSSPFRRFRFFNKPDIEKIKRIFKWAIPTVIENFLFCFLSMFISRLVTSYGAYALAAQRVGGQIDSLSWLIAGGFCTAYTSFTGQNYGAKRLDRIRESFKIATAAMIVWGIVVFVVLFFLGRYLIGAFLPGEYVAIEIGTLYMKIISVCEIFACLEGIASGAFRGRGKTLPPAIISITVNTLRVIAAYILSKTALGLSGVFVAISGGMMIRGSITYIYYAVYARKTANKPIDLPDSSSEQIIFFQD